MAYDAVRAGSLQMGLLVVAPVHTDRQAAGRSGHLDVVGGVADHHRHRRIDPDLGHGHLQQMGMRLAGPVVSRLEIRSEEHTSELQSLMRISYAVFFLKKKTKLDRENINKQNNS